MLATGRGFGCRDDRDTPQIALSGSGAGLGSLEHLTSDQKLLIVIYYLNTNYQFWYLVISLGLSLPFGSGAGSPGCGNVGSGLGPEIINCYLLSKY